MTEKRADDTGSIEEDRRGRGHWARLPRAHGRRSLGLFPTREAAAEALAAELERFVEQPPDVLTVARYGRRWLDRRAASGDYRSVDSERRRWADYVEESALGNTPIGRVTPGDVRRWLRELDGKAPQTRRNALSLVRGVLRSAVEDEHLVTDPTRDIRVPKAARAGEKDRWTWLDAHELAALLSVRLPSQRTPPERWISIWTVAAYSGLRAGELWALTWDDVDERRGVICVRRAVTERGRLGPPKGGQAREVPLLAPARTALAAWRAVAPRSPRGLVWPSEHGGGHHRTGYQAQIKVGLRAAGIERRVRFHDLRHTCGSHLLQGTWAPWIVARALRLEEVRDWLGHGDITVTQRYAHLAPGGLSSLVTDRVADGARDRRDAPAISAILAGIPKPEVGGSNPPGDARVVGQLSVSVVDELEALSMAAGRAIRDGDEHRDHRSLDLVACAKRLVAEFRAAAQRTTEAAEEGA